MPTPKLTLSILVILISIFFPLLAMAGGEAGTVEPSPPEGVLNPGSAIQLILGLFVVLFLIVASGWLFKRFGRWQGGYSDQLKIVGGLAVGARERIVLVQVGKQQLLVGIAPGNIRTLHVLDEPLPEVGPAGKGGPLVEKFATILKKQRNG